VGAEEGKGNRLTREAYPLFQNSRLNFVGNVEGMDLLTDKANVVVCDGFVGNIILKFAEGLGDAIGDYLKGKLKGKLSSSELEVLYGEVWELTNLSRKMSGPLFGVNGNVVIGHGASRSHEVVGALETAKRCVELDLARRIKDELASFAHSLSS
jgi:glycerol-3-phosphate acyltransferase PlsX